MTLDEATTKLGDRAKLIDDFDSGMSYKAVAEKYSIPIGTVKSRISRGRAIIRKIDDTQ